MRAVTLLAALLAFASSLAPPLDLITGTVQFGALGSGGKVLLRRTGLVAPTSGLDEPAVGPWLVSVNRTCPSPHQNS